jgi:hypothetical protein
MNIRLGVAVTMLFGSLAAGLIAGTAPRPRSLDAFADKGLEVAMLECASGFHTDALGDCQPDNGIVDSRCPAGSEATAFPNGNNYKCVPIPEGY